ncbi:hypothetical protein A2U01_0091356, partial [Trifolium medium]|nr:hypothetical protein [Trifolium medium]
MKLRDAPLDDPLEHNDLNCLAQRAILPARRATDRSPQLSSTLAGATRCPRLRVAQLTEASQGLLNTMAQRATSP